LDWRGQEWRKGGKLGNVVFILEEVREAWGGVENQKGFELHFGGGGQS
jgi:hypothetical protein